MRKPVALALVLALLIGGCWDRREIEDTAYVVSIGVDEAGDEFLWTFRLVEAEQLPVGNLTSLPAAPGRLASGVVTARGSGLEQAVQLIQAGSSRIISLEHLRYVVIGAPVARRGLEPVIRQLVRHNEIRLGAGLAVATDRAVDMFVNNRPVGEINPAKFMEGLLLVQRRLHLSPPIRVQHFLSRVLAPGTDPITALIAVNPTAAEEPGSSLPPMGGASYRAGDFPRAGGNPLELAGAAVFKGYRLAGTLTVDETAGLLALRGEMGKVYASVPDPVKAGSLISLRIHQENKPQYRIGWSGGRPAVAVKLQFEGEILAIPSGVDYTTPGQRLRLQRQLAQHQEETVFRPLVRKIYQDWGADPVGFGQIFRTRFPTFDAWLDYRWSERVQDLQVTVETEFFIRRFGLWLDDRESMPPRR